MCSPLISLSVAVRCFYGESDVDCSKPMRPGTRAKGECKPSYNQIRPPPYREIICRDDGQWSDELFYCQPGKNLVFLNVHNVSLMKLNETACINNLKIYVSTSREKITTYLNITV